MAGQTVVFRLNTTVATAKKDLEEAAERVAQGKLKEKLGRLAAPVGSKAAEILGQKAEEILSGEAGETQGPFTCVIMPGRGNVPPPGGVISMQDWRNVDFYEDPGIKLILTEFEALSRKGETIAYAEYNHPDASSIGAGIAECGTQRDGGPGTGPFWPFMEERGLRFDRVIVLTHAKSSLGPGRDARDPPSVGPNISGAIIPEMVYSEVGPYLKEGGELYVIACGQWQTEWEKPATQVGASFFITVWPGEGRCGDVGEIIDMIKNK